MAGQQCQFLETQSLKLPFLVAKASKWISNQKPDSTSPKVLPPWMIKKEMNLTMEQCGEVKQESNAEDDKTSLRNEYIKEYNAALTKKQQELEEAAKNQQEPVLDGLFGVSSNRQVGMKCKRKEDGEGDDIDWEEA